MILSVGPPELQAKTGSPHAIASMGTIPKCSFVGVYRRASVDGLRRRAERCAVVKLSKKRTRGSSGAFGGRRSEAEAGRTCDEMML